MSYRFVCTVLLCILPFITTITYSESIHCNGDSDCNCPFNPTDEMCIFSCDDTDICKDKILNCQDGRSCEIQCNATTACAEGTIINARTATDVVITCQGSDACKEGLHIFCGTKICELHCIGETSCANININVSLSSSFTCFGDCAFTSLTTQHPTQLPHSNTAPDANYLTDPLFYVVFIFGLVVLCGCCIFCIWIYGNEIQQRHTEYKAKTISAINLHIIAGSPDNACITGYASKVPKLKAGDHTIHTFSNRSTNDNETTNTTQGVKASIDSSELYNYEGPVPTQLCMKTIDMLTHRALMQPRYSDAPASNTPLALMSGPPRSIHSSPPQTPIPNEYDKEDLDYRYTVGALNEHQLGGRVWHNRYESLPTVPSLPQEQSTSSVTEMNVNMTLSMVSRMVVEDDSAHSVPRDYVEPSESAEYQSHHKQTFESYDLASSPFSRAFSKSNNPAKYRHVPNITEFDRSEIGNVSAVKLPDISELHDIDVGHSVSRTYDDEDMRSETSVISNQNVDGDRLKQ